MSVQSFIKKENINMLWDVISDEELFRFLPQDVQSNIYQLFVNNLQGFYENEKSKSNSVVEMNKKYIMLILGYIKKNFNASVPSKITIHDEIVPIKSLITFEDIQKERKSKFEEELHSKQEEFEDFMHIKPPPVPEFTDKQYDTPIKEMDKKLKEMQLQRNYEIEQINQSYNQTPQMQTDTWLKPQETSSKPLSTQFDKKSVSFNDTNDIINEEDAFIFSKLKKINTSEERLLHLETEVKHIHEKLAKILDILLVKTVS